MTGVSRGSHVLDSEVCSYTGPCVMGAMRVSVLHDKIKTCIHTVFCNRMSQSANVRHPAVVKCSAAV